MDSMRAAWTDERLDDLAARVEMGFDRVDTDVRELRSEVNTRFDSMQRQMAGIGSRWPASNTRWSACSGR
jgi:hypothetical protein